MLVFEDYFQKSATIKMFTGCGANMKTRREKSMLPFDFQMFKSKRQTPNVKRQTSNAERQTPNAKRPSHPVD